jgi:hypothetical protein
MAQSEREHAGGQDARRRGRGFNVGAAGLRANIRAAPNGVLNAVVGQSARAQKRLGARSIGLTAAARLSTRQADRKAIGSCG